MHLGRVFISWNKSANFSQSWQIFAGFKGSDQIPCVWEDLQISRFLLEVLQTSMGRAGVSPREDGAHLLPPSGSSLPLSAVRWPFRSWNYKERRGSLKPELKFCLKEQKSTVAHEVYCSRCVGGLHRNSTNMTEENNLTPKLMFKVTKIKFKNQNALLKIIFGLQGFTLL